MPTCTVILLPQLLAILQVPDPEKEPGTVLEVTAPGYILNGRVLRAADVVVVQEQ